VPSPSSPPHLEFDVVSSRPELQRVSLSHRHASSLRHPSTRPEHVALSASTSSHSIENAPLYRHRYAGCETFLDAPVFSFGSLLVQLSLEPCQHETRRISYDESAVHFQYRSGRSRAGAVHWFCSLEGVYWLKPIKVSGFPPANPVSTLALLRAAACVGRIHRRQSWTRPCAKCIHR
jgi:hypothetical protein